MYTLVKALGRPKGRRALIDTIDVSMIPLLELSQYYTDVYFVLSNPIYKEPKALFFNDLSIEDQISNLTITQFLEKNGNKTLNTANFLPQHLRGYVYAWDADSWGFDIKSFKLGMHPRARIVDEDKTDLHVSRKKMDHLHAGKYSLISINGLFHYHEYDESGWTILEGNKTKLKDPNKTHVNILDFTQVGEVQLKKIKPSMIRPPVGNVPLTDNCYIDCGTSLSNKTVGIVIGGYFHLLDTTYKQINDSTIKIDFNNMQLETLYYKMKELIDVSSLPLTELGSNRVIGFEFYHDNFIRALLALPQSFLVLIHNPHLTVNEIQVGDMGIPKRYESAVPPVYPLRIGEGRYPGYKALKGNDKWVLCVEDNIVPLQVRYQRARDEFHVIHNEQRPINGETYATAHYIIITSDKDMAIKSIDPLFTEAAHYIGPLRPFMINQGTNTLNTEDKVSQYYLPPKIINEDFNSEYYHPTTIPFVE